MRADLATVCLSGTLEDKLVAAAEAGFDGVEIFEPDLVASSLRPGDLRVLCRDLGLSIDLYQPFRDLDSTDPDRFAANLRRAERKFDVMESLGVGTVLVCSSVSPDAVTDPDELAAQLAALASRAAARGLRIAFEALAWGTYVNTYEHSWDVVRRADHPALGLCLDSFHILSRGSDPAPIARIPAEKLFFLQLADAPVLSMDVLQWSRHHRLFPGQGAFDLPGFLRAVLAAGYAGPLSLEVFNDVFRQADPARTAVDARRSLLALEDAVSPAAVSPAAAPAAVSRAAVSRAAVSAAPTGPGPAAAGPVDPAPALAGHAFVELLASSSSEAEELGRVLGALGFSRTGRHRSKPVERWEQGRARVLLNAADSAAGPAAGREAAGPAAGREAVGREAAGREADGGGAVVGALAVESADPPAAARRAQRLLAPLLPRDRGPSEADLAAVAAPDGTPLFFCRTGATGPGAWSVDFDPLEPTASAPAAPAATSAAPATPATPAAAPAAPAAGPGGIGVTGIDHVGLSEPFDRFDEAALFHRAVLGLTPLSTGEFAAPFGLIRGRALTDPARSVRIALTVSRLRRGDWAPAVAEPQYVAFAVDDVIESARRARAAGAPLLAIPDNYYDDLDARLDIPPDRLAAYRDLGILHTEDTGTGAYLHVSTPLLGGRLFLALAQRVDGYDGYGWADAPVRMTAHRRHRLVRSG
ncbi:sugar phosphate isomerase/epimerase and 4-hydroxyphenylpyruvate domain-containing protein [Cryptosporangium phraense]|uniref:3-dehydroshikimate dehydratase n=1 Tax=Cryptosporangium phraense TaxID=2593070 RepID=A0A545AXE7_9ACTN|nr:sugar phosphate isomerase/epimerase and 4-hydroxyphenylpyruvate domain-containing protein [Cryptosporangium phraense]TQS46002.1 sugar phosphate isomerase/epimerase and 4-hydroxyphenylpyruvate domain-containing protein [Cryptosporangium phraense]